MDITEPTAVALIDFAKRLEADPGATGNEKLAAILARRSVTQDAEIVALKERLDAVERQLGPLRGHPLGIARFD